MKIPKSLKEYLENRIPDDGKCHCNFRIKMVGDGCQYCNPEIVERYKEESINENDYEG